MNISHLLERMSFYFLTSAILTTTSCAQTNPLRIVFFGDSITEFGVKPGGYVLKIGKVLADKGLANQFELIGAGVSGNKVYDLFLRMEDDVLAKSPSTVVIYVGVNDVWHKTLLGTGTDADKFEKFYAAIITKLQAKGIKLILCTPGVVGELNDNSNPQDGDLNYYSKIIRNLAKQYNCSLCDLRTAFGGYIAKNNPNNKPSGILTTDRVHLNEAGNQMVAEMLTNELLK